MSSYVQKLKHFWYIAFLTIVLTGLLAFLLSFVSTPKYESTVKLLVIQKQGSRLDAYTAARSAETVSEILSKVVYTSSFFDAVFESGFKLKNQFSSDPEERRTEWEEAVRTGVVDNKGTLEIRVYDEERSQATELAYAIAYVLVSRGKYYHGGGDDIQIKMIDSPLTSISPVEPNFIENTLAGVFLGILLGFGIIMLLPVPGHRYAPHPKKPSAFKGPKSIEPYHPSALMPLPKPAAQNKRKPGIASTMTIGDVQTLSNDLERAKVLSAARKEYEQKLTQEQQEASRSAQPAYIPAPKRFERPAEQKIEQKNKKPLFGFSGSKKEFQALTRKREAVTPQQIPQQNNKRQESQPIKQMVPGQVVRFGESKKPEPSRQPFQKPVTPQAPIVPPQKQERQEYKEEKRSAPPASFPPSRPSKPSPGFVSFADFKAKVSEQQKSGGVASSTSDAKSSAPAGLPMIENSSQPVAPPAPPQEPQQPSAQATASDYYHPESVDEWMKSGKFKPHTDHEE